jgi:putative membrane-bound dehydrogenase-like protein
MNTLRLCGLAGLAASLAALLCGAVLPQRGKAPGDRHDPANAVANLDVHPQLQATLFASEPAITNPTNLDIDVRGRVWICDVVNYRGNNGKRPAGDRILILEDTDGDGKADKVTTFYQGRDVDSAMGICVLGNKVIVSCSPNILVFTFDPATDKILKKETLFTRTGQPQHDHSAHSFVFGPDGRYYWNFGNTGQAVHDKNGKPVIDLAGNRVADNGKPYFGGMAFRCNPDGSDFEVLAHNFRNNYEVAVDSFGTLWQSDNDDDGNRGVRINYVMEYGNYGYRDEMTGAGWGSPRTNIEKEIPLRHWHLNDPGVVPNLLQTGQGSPTGICVYEGNLLPQVFHNQVIHCDAGPSIVRAYPAKKQGAGYTAEIVNILDGNRKNNWFRPADVCVAPDGSLFVTDWYDPGVGGHAQRDLDRGRIFRVAPPGKKYKVPTFDFKTPEGAAEALKNPALSVRYLAWTALHALGEKAEPALTKLWWSTDSVMRARALWLLGRIDGKGPRYVAQALKKADPDVRITGLRLARQLKLDLIPLVRQLAIRAQPPEVRRECAIALRHNKAPEAAGLWAELALLHDGKDRWYLEALGIGADRQWDAFFDTWLKRAGHKAMATAAGRDVVWRSRAQRTPEYLAKVIRDPATPAAELPRFFRAFDFQSGEGKTAALMALVTAEPVGDAARRDFTLQESVKRLKGVDPSKNPQFAAALERVADTMKGTAGYIEVVSQFRLTKHYPELLGLAQQDRDPQLAVNAVRALLERGQGPLLQSALEGKDLKRAQATVQALGTAADDRTTGLLLPLMQNRKRDVEQRRLAVRALARTKSGAGALLQLARTGKLGEELKQAAGAALTTAPWKNVKAEASKLFPLPPTKDRPLPAFAELLKMRGNTARGEKVFRTTGKCATCHVVNGDGKDVGPNLSEIGKKLSREAVWESILYPSAAISHNYETYVVELKSGATETGLMASDAADAVTLKGADGILRTLKRADIDRISRSPVSLMPADLHQALTTQDLADLVDYLLTLREARPGKGGKK